MRDDHPLTRLRRPLLLTDLADYPGAAMQEGFGVRQHIQAAEISEQVRLRNVLTTSSFKALWQFAATGIGYALTPPIAVTADLRAQPGQPAAVQSDPEPGQPAGAEPGRPPCVPGRAGAAGPYRARHCPAGRRDICYARLSRSCAATRRHAGLHCLDDITTGAGHAGFLAHGQDRVVGFLGIRRRRDYDADIAGNKPGHVIATGLLMAAVLVTLLVAAARWAVRAAL